MTDEVNEGVLRRVVQHVGYEGPSHLVVNRQLWQQRTDIEAFDNLVEAVSHFGVLHTADVEVGEWQS